MKLWWMAGLLGMARLAMAEFTAGDLPPDFTCTDWNGNTWNLAENRGKVVLLNFGATWCGPCNDEMPELQSEFYEHYDPAGFAIVHIDTDGITASALHNHWGPLGVTFPVLVGCNGLYDDYGNGYVPYNCLLNGDGEVLYGDSGYNPGALHSLIEANLHVDRPVLRLDALAAMDSGNSDGRPDGGETVTLNPSLSLSNIGEACTGGTISATSDDPAITFTQSSMGFLAGQPGQPLSTTGGITFTVAEGIEPHWATINLTYSADHAGGTAEGELSGTLRMGRPGLLLVDTDGEDDNETFIQTALVNLGLESDVWAGYDSPLASDEILRYSQVIWLGGQNQQDVTDSEEAALRAFVLGGGRLLLSSQYLSDNPERADFLADIFGVTVTNADAGNIFVVDCVAGDPWWNGTALVVSGTGGAGNNEEPDVLAVDTAVGTVLGNWRQAPGGPAAVYTNGERKAIFCGFPVEAARVHGSVAGSMNATTLLEHVLAYFGETGVEEPLAPRAADFRIASANPNPFNPVTTLELELAVAGDVELTLHNLAGQEVRRIQVGQLPAGTRRISVDGAGLASGLYLAQLRVDGLARDTRKLMLVK